MFRILGQLVCRYPWLWIGIWLSTALVTGLAAPTSAELSVTEPASLLPEDAALNEALRVHAAAFPQQAARSNIVLVFYRASGLNTEDRQFLQKVAEQLTREGKEGSEKWRVFWGGSGAAWRLRLESADGQAAIVLVNLDVNFITRRATLAVERVQQIVQAQHLPDGLTFEVTGTAGIGKEHNDRSVAARERTTWVTVVAVLILLALVYRSPLGALVPLVSIGLSVFVAFRVLDFLAVSGWQISEAERTFTVVLLFGAGTDYALFWISRYREELSYGGRRSKAAINAMIHVGPAILASAGTTIVGLMMLMSAEMVIIKTSGKVLGIVLTISLLAAMTLTPAMAMVMGRGFFWPRRPQAGFSLGQRLLWPKVARKVVRHPHVVFGCGLLVIAIPALFSISVPLRYDSFGEVASKSSAERGLELAKEHFSEEELFSTRFLIKSSAFGASLDAVRAASEQLANRLSQVQGVTDVWHLGAPLGKRPTRALSMLLASPVVQGQVKEFYLARDQSIIQLEVMQHSPPLSLEALAVYRHLRQAIKRWAEENLEPGYEIFAIGQTPYIADVKSIADRDLSRVIWLVMATIWLIVLALIRRLLLAMFMLVATLITYSAAIGLTNLYFVDFLGRAGVDYKIRILVFVIIVAVGQDYNIFLVTRMLDEVRSFSLKEAITRSIVVTGPVISSCGLIMAATLGSLCTTRIDLTQQLGFAFAAGVLIDTFLVRPLLIPSFYLIIERSRKPAARHLDRASTPSALVSQE